MVLEYDLISVFRQVDLLWTLHLTLSATKTKKNPELLVVLVSQHVLITKVIGDHHVSLFQMLQQCYGQVMVKNPD